MSMNENSARFGEAGEAARSGLMNRRSFLLGSAVSVGALGLADV